MLRWEKRMGSYTLTFSISLDCINFRTLRIITKWIVLFRSLRNRSRGLKPIEDYEVRRFESWSVNFDLAVATSWNWVTVINTTPLLLSASFSSFFESLLDRIVLRLIHKFQSSRFSLSCPSPEGNSPDCNSGRTARQQTGLLIPDRLVLSHSPDWSWQGELSWMHRCFSGNVQSGVRTVTFFFQFHRIFTSAGKPPEVSHLPSIMKIRLTEA